MHMHEVKSSQIHSIGHDPVGQRLTIKFHGNGAVYHYANVSAAKFEELKAAESTGKHFALHIRNNPDHPHTKEG